MVSPARPGRKGWAARGTESFRHSFIAIIVLNFFFFAKVAKDWYVAIYCIRSIS